MKPGRVIKRVAVFFAWTLVILAVLVVALFAVGPTVPLDPITPSIQRALSDATGYRVTLSNATCRVALEPAVSVGHLRVTEPGSGGDSLVVAESLRFTTSLPAFLFANAVRIQDASIQDLELRVPARSDEETPAEPDENGDAFELPDLPLLDLVNLGVDQLLVHCAVGDRVEEVTLSDISLSAPLVDSTHLELKAAWGAYQGSIEFWGGNLNSLLRGPSVWPARLEVVTDLGTLEAGAMLRGSPLPGDPRVALTALLKDVSLDGVVPEGRGLDLSRALVHARWEGLAPNEILTSMDLQALVEDVDLTLTDQANGEERPAHLDHMVVAWRPDEEIMVLSEGEFLGEAVHVAADAGPVASWPPPDGLPFSLRADGAGARLRAVGTWDGWADGPALQLRADLAGDQIGGLAPWVGCSPDADLPYRLVFAYRLQAAAARLELEQAFVGSTRLTGHLQRVSAEEGPLREIALAFERVDLQELSRISGDSRSVAVEDAQDDASAKRLRLDAPVLPASMHLPDADLVLDIAELQAGRSGVRNVRTHLTFRDGWLERSPFSLEAAQATWTGECFLDARKAVPVLGVELRADDAAVHELIPVLEDDPDLSILAGHVLAKAEVEGATVRQMLSNNRMALQAEEVDIRLPRPKGQDPIQVSIPSLTMSRPVQGEGLQVEAEMAMGGKAARLQGQVGLSGKEVEGDGLGLRLQGTLETESTEASLAGDIRLPFRSGDIDFAVRVLTQRPAWLTDRVGLEWEPVAPLEFAGRVKGRDGQYDIHDLDASLNRSRLTGRAHIGVSPDEILWSVEGRSEVLHLEDLGMGDRTNEVASASDEDDPETSPDEGRAVKGKIVLQLDEVQYRDIALGGGSFGLTLEPGRMVLEPIQVVSEDRYGDMVFSSEKLSGEGAKQYDIGVTATNLPVSLLALLSPKFAANQATAYADVRLVSAMPTNDPRFAAHLSGEAGFALFPDNIRSSLLDYWAVGAIQALGMTLAGRGESKVECIAGRLHFEDGMARPHEMYIDTSRVRVKCTGWIDLDSGKLHLKMKPRPKGMAFISLATPVEVKGTLEDPDIQVTTRAVAGTVVRIYFWFVTAIDSLFRKNIPEHDHEGYMRMMSGKKP